MESQERKDTSERPFKCQKCEKSFTRADALNKHTKRHEAGDRATQSLVETCFYTGELRDFIELQTEEILREKQLEINCQRVLHSFITERLGK